MKVCADHLVFFQSIFLVEFRHSFYATFVETTYYYADRKKTWRQII